MTRKKSERYPVMHPRVNRELYARTVAILTDMMGEKPSSHEQVFDFALNFTCDYVRDAEAEMRRTVLASLNQHLKHFVLEGQADALRAAGLEDVQILPDPSTGLMAVTWLTDAGRCAMPCQDAFVYGPGQKPETARNDYALRTLPTEKPNLMVVRNINDAPGDDPAPAVETPKDPSWAKPAQLERLRRPEVSAEDMDEDE